MRTNLREAVRAALPALAFLALVSALAARGATSTKEHRQEAAFQEFLRRVDSYMQLHKSVEDKLPKLKPTDKPEVIVAHQEALAQKIREARSAARHGDIFTHEAREAFRHVIRRELLGPQGHHARATMQQGAPPQVRLAVNQPYPEGVPYATVPPTLLLKLPRLPDEVAYQIVGHDLVLLDVKANLVVDWIPNAVP